MEANLNPRYWQARQHDEETSSEHMEFLTREHGDMAWDVFAIPIQVETIEGFESHVRLGESHRNNVLDVICTTNPLKMRTYLKCYIWAYIYN